MIHKHMNLKMWLYSWKYGDLTGWTLFSQEYHSCDEIVFSILKYYWAKSWICNGFNYFTELNFSLRNSYQLFSIMYSDYIYTFFFSLLFYIFFWLYNLVCFLYKLYVFSILLTILHLSCGLLTFQSFSILLIIVNHRICSNVLSSSTKLLSCMELTLPQTVLSNL